MNDADIIGVCGNCQQWKRRSNGGDCLNQCTARKFEPPLSAQIAYLVSDGDPDLFDEIKAHLKGEL